MYLIANNQPFFQRALNPKYLNILARIKALDRIVQAGLWISMFCSLDDDYEAITDALKENPTYSVNLMLNPVVYGNDGPTLKITKVKLFNMNNKAVMETKEFPCPGFIKKIGNKRLVTFFGHVTQLVGESKYLKIVKHAPKNFIAPIPALALENVMSIHMTEEDTPLIEDLFHFRLVKLLLEFFVDSGCSTPYDDQARDKLKCVSFFQCNKFNTHQHFCIHRYYSDFQLYFMDSLILLVSRTPKNLDAFILQDLYKIFFSPYFYFFGGTNNIINLYQPAPQPPKLNAQIQKPEDRVEFESTQQIEQVANMDKILEEEEEEEDNTEKKHVAENTAIILRESVLTFLKYAATINGKDNTEECKQLLVC